MYKEKGSDELTNGQWSWSKCNPCVESALLVQNQKVVILGNKYLSFFTSLLQVFQIGFPGHSYFHATNGAHTSLAKACHNGLWDMLICIEPDT